MTADGLFTLDDMSRMAESGFDGMAPSDVFTAISAAVRAPRLDDGSAVDTATYNPQALGDGLVEAYIDAIAPRVVLGIEEALTPEDAADEEAVASAMGVVAGVTPDEYAAAKDERDAGFPSRLCDIRARYIERS